MSDEQIKQRIQYLVEHGGLWHDPLEEAQRNARAALRIAGLVLVLSITELIFLALR
jgi:hypothetical protein